MARMFMKYSEEGNLLYELRLEGDVLYYYLHVFKEVAVEMKSLFTLSEK